MPDFRNWMISLANQDGLSALQFRKITGKMSFSFVYIDLNHD